MFCTLHNYTIIWCLSFFYFLFLKNDLDSQLNWFPYKSIQFYYAHTCDTKLSWLRWIKFSMSCQVQFLQVLCIARHFVTDCAWQNRLPGNGVWFHALHVHMWPKGLISLMACCSHFLSLSSSQNGWNDLVLAIVSSFVCPATIVQSTCVSVATSMMIYSTKSWRLGSMNDSGSIIILCHACIYMHTVALRCS